MNNKYRDVLDAAARSRIPDGLNLYPRIAANLEKKTLVQTLRARPVLMILFILLALGLLTGVAYAVGRSLGYIPGVGLVEQGAPIRVLAEPVSLTRDGITVTVSTAVLTPDQSTFIYSVDNVPFSAYSHNENVTGCSDMAKIKLPTGGALFFRDGSGSLNQTRVSFSEIPVDVNDATFILPCIQDTLPGLAPENWQLNLRFKPAPADLTVVPVVEIQATETPLPEPGKTISPSVILATPAPLSLIKALQVGEDTILLFSIKQPDAGGWIEFKNIKLVDAQGAEIYTANPTLDGLPAFDAGVQFKSSVSFPVTISVSGSLIAPLPDSLAEFEFDAGNNPQPGQEWTPNQPMQIGGRTLTLTRVRTDSRGGYSFDFNADPDVTGLSLEIAGYSSNGGGGGGSVGTGQFGITVSYADLPKGKLRVKLSNLTVAGPQQTWSMQWSPAKTSAPASLYGASIKVDQFMPLEDGYYLIGHTEWQDDRLKSLQVLRIQAQDASGREVLMEPVDAQNSGLNLTGNQWAYHIFGKVFQGPLALRADEVLVEFKNPVLYQVDLRPYQFKFDDSQLDIPYKTGIKTLDIPGILVSAFKATYIKVGDLRGFEIAMEADPELRNLSFRIASALDTTGMRQVAGSNGSFRDESSGLLLSRVLTDAKMSFPLVLAADSANISGHWQTTWNPPAPPAGATPVYAPQACLNLASWKSLLKTPAALPAGIPARALVARGALSPEPSLFLQNLDGSHEKPLVFGNGSLSPDGSRLAYSDENENIQILELASGQKQKVTAGVNAMPFWSPDGKKLAYSHQTDQGMNIFVMDANGLNQTALTELTINPELRGWTPDGRNLVIVAAQAAESQVVLLDTVTKQIKPLFLTLGSTWDVTASLSPDGQWLAYAEKVSGRIGTGIYVSHLDGSGKRLLVQLDYWPATLPVWSPDGKWLAFSANNNDLPDGSSTSGLINVDTCQVVPLPALQGEIRGWVNP